MLVRLCSSTLPHVGWPVVAHCGVLVVRPTEQDDAVRAMLLEPRPGIEVVELEELPGRATPPLRGDEGTAPSVSRVDLPPDCRGKVSGGLSCHGLGVLSHTPRSAGESLALGVGDQKLQPAVEDLGHVSGGDLVSQQGLGLAQRIVELAIGGELNAKASLAQGLRARAGLGRRAAADSGRRHR